MQTLKDVAVGKKVFVVKTNEEGAGEKRVLGLGDIKKNKGVLR